MFIHRRHDWDTILSHGKSLDASLADAPNTRAAQQCSIQRVSRHEYAYIARWGTTTSSSNPNSNPAPNERSAMRRVSGPVKGTQSIPQTHRIGATPS